MNSEEIRIFVASPKENEVLDDNIENIMDIAEEQGTVYTLNGFINEYFNNGTVVKVAIMKDGELVKEIK